MEESEVLRETMKHVQAVQRMMFKVVFDLQQRLLEHDASKFQSPEFEIFCEYTAKLKDCTYGSDEYKRYLTEMKPALDHHYANNRHHPEFHKDGINGMTLVDLLEMIIDWKAATMRHANGDIFCSIEQNKTRFNYGEQLAQILENTIRIYGLE